jgi:hypothetical protein
LRYIGALVGAPSPFEVRRGSLRSLRHKIKGTSVSKNRQQRFLLAPHRLSTDHNSSTLYNFR